MERHVFKRWNDLTNEEKEKNSILSRAAIEWMVKNPGKLLSYNEMNNCGLLHFYKWHVNDYNATHQWTKMKIKEDGIVIERAE